MAGSSENGGYTLLRILFKTYAIFLASAAGKKWLHDQFVLCTELETDQDVDNFMEFLSGAYTVSS